MCIKSSPIEGRAGERSGCPPAGRWFFLLLFCLSLGLAWFFHHDATRFDDRHEMWSDRAGYYIYLPSVMCYHFDARRMPPDLDIRTGGGFSIDTVRNRIDTKYTYGVALMQAPFFAAAGGIARLTGHDGENGFSMIHLRMMMLAAVVYLTLGLWLLKRFLDRYLRPVTAYAVILLLFAGTNLFYYSLVDGMMSHVYSFFLVTLYLTALLKFRATGRYRWFLLLSAALAMITLIRPANLILALLLPAWDAPGIAAFRKNLAALVKPSYLLTLAAVFFLFFLPQMIYWKYLSGHWIHFSYGSEGFTNWRHPRIAEVLFSPVNGLIATTPLVLFMLAGTGGMIFRRKTNGWPVATIFLLVSLICGAWSMWYFGCSYGQRSFIEYYPVLALPLGYVVQGIGAGRSFLVRTLFLFLLLLTVYFPLRYTLALYRHDRCYYGSTWDWDHYTRSIEKAGILSPLQPAASFRNDFENLALFPGRHPSAVFTRSGQYSVRSDAGDRSPVLFERKLYEFTPPWPKRMEVQAWVMAPGRIGGGEALSYAVLRGNTVIFDDRVPLPDRRTEPMTWNPVQGEFIVPDLPDSSLTLRIFLDNPCGTLWFADDLTLRFHYRW